MLTVWALADERAGNRGQVLGVSEALGLPFTIKEIRYGPLARLPNAVLGASLAGLTADSRAALSAPWPDGVPDVVIAAGRRAAPVLRAIKRRAAGRTFVVQLMNPGGWRDDLDLVAVPAHDGLAEAPNIVRTVGSPHRVTPERLAAARTEWLSQLQHLPRPRIAVMVGGSTRRRGFTSEMARALARTASQLAADAGGSLLVSTSRRTGDAADDLITAITVPHHAYRYRDSGENPYLGYLAVADAVIVTGDSASMCTEACATEAPVYIYAPPGYAAAKLRRLHQSLFDHGCARPMGSDFGECRLESWRHPAINSAGTVAREILRRLKTAAG
jgi:uncharacterized protein